MKKLPLLLLLMLGWNLISTIAQNYYTVQVGTFLEAKRSDFEAIQPIGLIHAIPTQGNLSLVFAGGYETREAAERALSQVKGKGYANAFVQEKIPAEGQEVLIIQLATKTATQPIEWENYTQIGDIYAMLNGNSTKIVTGFYQNMDVAKQQLNLIRQAGFRDAFVKSVNTIFLTKITEFETGLKKPLIPLELSQPRTVPVPGSYDQPTVNPDLTPRTPSGPTVRMVSQPAMPRIHSNIKRRSVLELQKVLKAEGHYKSSLDGYYGDGTASAYETMKDNNRELQKYIVLAEHIDVSGTTTSGNRLQDAINNLPSDSNAPRVIENANAPIAKAYRAYLLYNSIGRSNEVNVLMNTAIREAFASKKSSSPPPFDYQATYAYDNLEQLLLHLQYIHSAPGNDIAAPCWLFQRHPREMQRVFERYANVATPNFLLQACDQFLNWEDLSIAHAIAADLNIEKKLDQKQIAQGASLRAMLYLAPERLDADVAKDLQAWNDKLFAGLTGWATRDPLNQRTLIAFKAAYFHSQIRLEDFFIDKGFKEDEAKTLALATLRTVVGYHLERFI
ncbi:MAG: SPOR domain-containing protein [Saprospiraceae bacterium]|nr:SPOR domain-containing protein [Saprospiraceae bacterium]